MLSHLTPDQKRTELLYGAELLPQIHRTWLPTRTSQGVLVVALNILLVLNLAVIILMLTPEAGDENPQNTPQDILQQAKAYPSDSPTAHLSESDFPPAKSVDQAVSPTVKTDHRPAIAVAKSIQADDSRTLQKPSLEPEAEDATPRFFGMELN